MTIKLFFVAVIFSFVLWNSNCIAKDCIDPGDCPPSETCCNDKCVKGTNCLGLKCVLDQDCLPQEKCCVDKCAEKTSSNPCLDPVFIFLIVMACVIVGGGTISFIVVYVIVRRRRSNRLQAQRCGHVVAPPAQQPYQQFENEETLDSENTVQESLPSVQPRYEMTSHETNADDQSHVESSLPTA